MSMTAKSLIGNRYGRLLVLDRTANLGKEPRWLCRCECGTEKLVLGLSLKSGSTRSCGCLAVERTIERSTTHGRTGTTEWKAWAAMIARCSNENIKSYKDYGGRGISVCDRWKSFEAFFSDMGERPSSNHQLDRIDNNGNYEPSNCRWSTRKQNMQNRRVTRRYGGLTIRQIAEQTGQNYNTLKTWARRGQMPYLEDS
jgi:hypothetical protein